MFYYFLEVPTCSISHIHFDDLWKFGDKVLSCYTTNRPSINTNLPSDFNFIDQKLQNSLSIHFLLCRHKVRSKKTLLTSSIASVIPNKHICVSPDKKFKPVGICAMDHPLINKCIWITHYYGWSIERINAILQTWEEHAVYWWLTIAFNHVMRGLKVFFKNELALVKLSKKHVCLVFAIYVPASSDANAIAAEGIVAKNSAESICGCSRFLN